VRRRISLRDIQERMAIKASLPPFFKIFGKRFQLWWIVAYLQSTVFLIYMGQQIKMTKSVHIFM
jgi:hypothetical protein